MEELRIETYDAANIRYRVMDESEEGDGTAPISSPASQSPTRRNAPAGGRERDFGDIGPDSSISTLSDDKLALE